MVSILAHPYSILLGCLVLGGLFLFPGLGKALDREGTARTVVAYDVLPGFLARIYGLILPWAEMSPTGLLLAGLLTRFAACGLSLLLLSFAIAEGVNLARGPRAIGLGHPGSQRRAPGSGNWHRHLGWEPVRPGCLRDAR